MAVEARRLNLFPPPLFTNRELMNPFEANEGGLCNAQLGYDVVPSTSETIPLPLYGYVDNVGADPLTSPIMKPAIQSVDSSFTYYSNDNFDLPLPSKKRSRASFNAMANCPVAQTPKSCAPFSFLGQDFSLQIEQQQLDTDRLIALHMERVKFEIEEKRKKEARTIMEAIEQGLRKKLRAKEAERERIGKLNHALEERVKSLSVENQIWRELAHTNEATANALRTNLEEALAQVKDVRTHGAGSDDSPDDAQSSCGSSGEVDETRTIVEEAKDKGITGKRKGCGEGTNRSCRNCGEEESCVLLLPCRHLCLCAPCGSNLHTCPICKSPKIASVHVNMSP